MKASSPGLPRYRRGFTQIPELDRLGRWAAGLSCVAYGARFGIRTSDSSLVERIMELLPPGTEVSKSPYVNRLYSIVAGSLAGAGAGRLNIVYADSLRLIRDADLEFVLRTFESDLHLYVAERARGRVFVHAGVVGWNGRAIVLPGRTLSGKSTLVTALLKAGCTYYSDEFAVIDKKGLVHPFPRPIQLRVRKGKEIRKAARDFGAPTGIKPLSIKLVVFSKYRKGASWRPREMTGGQAALQLLDNTVSARNNPRAAIEVLQQVMTVSRALRTLRGEAGAAANAILRYVDEPG